MTFFKKNLGVRHSFFYPSLPAVAEAGAMNFHSCPPIMETPNVRQRKWACEAADSCISFICSMTLTAEVIPMRVSPQ